MNVFSISYKNLKAKPLSAILNLVLFATGIFIISFLFLLKKQFEFHFDKNIAGINLVVGAKGSPLQLILSSIYHIDNPTGNIKLSEADKLKHNPLIKQTIPLAMGDNYQSFRIVGTNHDYVTLYNGNIEKGSLWKDDFDVTIGAKVAIETGLDIGGHFSGVHGFIAESDDKHEEFQYKVTGILKETGTVLDQLILTNISSVWQIHSHHHHHHNDKAEEEDEYEIEEFHDEQDHHHEEADTAKEITSLLVFYRNPMGAISLPRNINKYSNLQAASPALEMNRLYSLMGIGIQSASLIALVIIVISGFSIFISLYSSMKERKYELALMRVMGGRKAKMFTIVIFEGLLISFSGYLLGFIFSRIGMIAISAYTESNFHYSIGNFLNVKDDLVLFAISMGVGFLASLLPAMKALRTNISRILSE